MIHGNCNNTATSITGRFKKHYSFINNKEKQKENFEKRLTPCTKNGTISNSKLPKFLKLC